MISWHAARRIRTAHADVGGVADPNAVTSVFRDRAPGHCDKVAVADVNAEIRLRDGRIPYQDAIAFVDVDPSARGRFDSDDNKDISRCTPSRATNFHSVAIEIREAPRNENEVVRDYEP